MTVRKLPEWIGANPDSKIPPRVQVRVFERYHGICQCGCGWKIQAGQAWEADHITALINGGEHRESNLQPLLIQHHRGKTALDVAIKSKTYRTKARHLGIKKSKKPMPGSKSSGWKRKMDGTWVKR